MRLFLVVFCISYLFKKRGFFSSLYLKVFLYQYLVCWIIASNIKTLFVWLFKGFIKETWEKRFLHRKKWSVWRGCAAEETTASLHHQEGVNPKRTVAHCIVPLSQAIQFTSHLLGAIFGLGVSSPRLQSNQPLQHLRWSILIWNMHLLLFSHISVRAEKLSPSKQAVDVLRAGRPSPWHLFKTQCFCLYKTAVQSRVRCCSMGIPWAVSGSAAFMREMEVTAPPRGFAPCRVFRLLFLSARRQKSYWLDYRENLWKGEEWAEWRMSLQNLE